MALAATEPPSLVHLLADAVDLVRAAARLGPARDRTSAAHARALLRELVAEADGLGAALPDARPSPAPLAVVPRPDPGGTATSRPGSLRLTSAGTEVRLAGRGPAAEGDLVRVALQRHADGEGTVAESSLGALMWRSLVALSRDGLEPPTAPPTPLGLVDRWR